MKLHKNRLQRISLDIPFQWRLVAKIGEGAKISGEGSRKFLAFVLKLCKRKQTCMKRKFIHKLDKILKEQN